MTVFEGPPNIKVRGVREEGKQARTLSELEVHVINWYQIRTRKSGSETPAKFHHDSSS